jgi:hypothetical protein
MKTQILFVALFLALLINGPVLPACAQGTAFTYQGRLNDGANAASGIYDLQFTVYDSTNQPGTVIAGPLTNLTTSVNNGLFNVALDFGNVFSGADRFLEIAVRTNGEVPFTALAPRQKISPTPYAVTAGSVADGNVARLNVPNTSAQATGHPVVTSGFITSAAVDNGGFGYATPPNVSVSDSSGSGAVVTAIISNGVVVTLTPTSAGSGYSSGATLTIGAPPPNNFQVFVTSNYFPNVNVFSNAANVFAGDGSGLTGVAVLAKANTFSSSNFFLGRVGIGTTTPARMLEVRNAGDTEIGIRSSDVGAHFWSLQSSGLTGSANLDASFQIVDRSISKARFYIGTNGNVGIGTTSPRGPMELQTPAGTNASLLLSSGGFLPLTLDLSPAGVGTISNGGAARITIQPTGEIGIGKTPNNGLALDVNGTVSATAVSATSFSGSGTGLSGLAVLTGGNVFSGNQIVSSGSRVGIGTTTPNAALHVSGSVVLQGPIAPASTAATNLLNIGSGVVADGFRNGISFFESGGNTAMSFGYDGTGNSAQNALRIYNTVDAPLFTFQANGNLGVGTTNPVTALDVIGSITTTNISSRTNDLAFVLNSVERMHIHNGRVGIGTNNPQDSLHIVGGGIRMDSTSGNGITAIGENSISFDPPGLHSASIDFNDAFNTNGLSFFTVGGVGGFSQMCMDSAGKLAVNAEGSGEGPSSRAALQVQDVSDTEIGIISGDTGGHYWTLQSSGVTGSANLDASFQIIDRTGVGHSRLIIRTNGNVGIGTSGPDELLSVNGSADKSGGGFWDSFSDGRLKDIGADFTNSLEALEGIHPVHFHYKSDNPLNLPAEPEYVGVVAQQVQGVVPEAVKQSPSGYLVVNDDPVFWTVVNAVKTLNHKLETENDELKRQNESLEKRLAAIEHKLGQNGNDATKPPRLK